MNILTTLQSSIADFDARQLNRIAFIFFGTTFLILGIITYLYWSSSSSWQERAMHVNKQRSEIAKIIQRHAKLTEQKGAVESIIERDPKFRINTAVSKTIEEAGLGSVQKQIHEVEEKNLGDDYLETAQTVMFSDINTKQLCQFLDLIEKNNRLFLQRLVINRGKGPTINVDLTVATLARKP